MKELPSDKYNVAWFKLAEFVARKEKERALALYRLLAHSFDDKALAYQLEGDLLLSFNDETAIKKYFSAALHYIKENRLIEAASVYEHLISLDSSNADYLIQVIKLYKNLNHSTHFVRNFLLLSRLYIHQNCLDKIADLLHHYEQTLTEEERSKIYPSITLNLIKKDPEHDLIKIMIKQTIEHLLLDSHNANALPVFITQLQAINEKIYKEARMYLDS